jgi:glycogen debranching enzyme
MHELGSWAASPVRLSLLLGVGLAMPSAVRAQQDYAAPIMAGISNHGKNGREPYVTAGDRAYLIGTQDGNFPDLGGHIPGEMGGLWLHPIKLIDGFWTTVADSASGKEASLSNSSEFLNYPYGNRLRYGRVLDGLEIDRFQFSPDSQPGVMVQYIFTNSGDQRKQLTLLLSVKTDLSPVWLSEKLNITDAPDTIAWQATSGRFLARDSQHPWFVIWGTSHPAGPQPIAHPKAITTKGMGATAAARYSVSVPAHDTASLTFVFAGSPTSRKAAETSFTFLAQNSPTLLAKKKAHYAALIHRARIRIPDQHLQEVYNWVRINAEWLIRDVPGVGRGLGAGFAEYPWWFGTETYSLQALAASGSPEIAMQDLRLLRDLSGKANGNGRIVHEVTTNGAVSNPGNTQETAQFILTVGRVVRWTGDLAFAREMYPAMEQGLHWLLAERDSNRNLFPEGYGITEILGLNAEVIDVAVYTQQALVATAEIAALLGLREAGERYRRLATELAAKINARFWLPEDGSYADFYGTRAQAISTAEGAIKQIGLKGEQQLTARDRELIGYYQDLKARFATMPDSSRGWITNKNWPVNTPMEMGIAPPERAAAILDRVRKEDVGEYGPYLAAVDKQAMMTIATGVLAVAEAEYGRVDQALWYMDRIVQTFNRKLPGSIAEMMPDEGCFTIAWTMYGIVVPLVQYIFGVQPQAASRTVVFEPHLPKGWENLSIEDLPVGTNLISFARSRTAKGIEYDIESKQEGWSFVLKAPALRGARYYLNGSPVPLLSQGIRMSGRKNHLQVILIGS